MAMHPERYRKIPAVGALRRLPLQVLFIYWMWLAALAED